MVEGSAETSACLQTGAYKGTSKQFVQASNVCKYVAKSIPPKLSSIEFCERLKKVQITTLFNDPLGWFDDGYKQGLQVTHSADLLSISSDICGPGFVGQHPFANSSMLSSLSGHCVVNTQRLSSQAPGF
jgi:hypothetical protein